MPGENNSRIIGIKAIADYLSISVRNVYRWERRLGLPIHRVASVKGYSVYAIREELDDWLKTRFNLKNKAVLNNKYILISLSIAAVMILTVAAVLVSMNIFVKNEKTTQNPHPNPVSADFEGNSVNILDENGEKLWSIVVNDRGIDAKHEALNNYVNISDFDDDGFNEVFGRYYDSSANKYYIVLMDGDGSQLWRRDVETNQPYDGIVLKSHYLLDYAQSTVTKNNERLFISQWRHVERFLVIFACHNIYGELKGLCLHTGTVTKFVLIDIDGDGEKEIVFSGTNNLLNGEGVVGLLPLQGFHGVLPPYRVEPEYADLAFRLRIYVPDNPLQGNQLLYLRFKKTDIMENFSHPYIFPQLKEISDGLIHIELFPWNLRLDGHYIGMEYVFDTGFHLKYIFPNSQLIEKYDDLLSEGHIDISLEELMGVYSKIIYRWADSGWVVNN